MRVGVLKFFSRFGGGFPLPLLPLDFGNPFRLPIPRFRNHFGSLRTPAIGTRLGKGRNIPVASPAGNQCSARNFLGLRLPSLPLLPLFFLLLLLSFLPLPFFVLICYHDSQTNRADDTESQPPNPEQFPPNGPKQKYADQHNQKAAAAERPALTTLADFGGADEPLRTGGGENAQDDPKVVADSFQQGLEHSNHRQQL